MINRFFKHSVFFGGATFLMYVIFIAIWGSFLPQGLNTNLIYKQRGGHLHTRINEIPKYQNIDVLFLGSSHAYRGFDTRVFEEKGISSFNLGSSSQAPVQTLVLLKKYLEQINPKRIVFEICPQALSSDGVESALDIISNDKIDWISTKMMFEVHNIKLYNTFIYSGIHQLFKQRKNFIEDKVIGKDTYISGGYVQRQNQKYIPQVSNQNYEIKQEQLDAFEKVVSLIKNKGIDLILVQAPVSTLEYESFKDNAGFNEKMKFYSTYYNFNTRILLEDSIHFYDSHHLNQEGVRIFNNKLIELLLY